MDTEGAQREETSFSGGWYLVLLKRDRRGLARVGRFVVCFDSLTDETDAWHGSVAATGEVIAGLGTFRLDCMEPSATRPSDRGPNTRLISDMQDNALR